MLWRKKINGASPDTAHSFGSEFEVHPFIISMLFNRNIRKSEDIWRFLHASTSDFHDPSLLQDVEKAANRIIRAILNREKIVIFGDYDVDGMTSTSIVYKALTFFKADVSFRVPLRKEGYGISVPLVDELHEKHKPSLLITVDNGSTAFDALLQAKKHGIDVIVTDHHTVLHGNPPCYAFVNPKRSDNTYPNSNLCGAGVALKLVQALFQKSRFPWEDYMYEYMEYAAVGTVADMVPLTGENRAIVKLGMTKLSFNPNLFFRMLFSSLYLSKHQINSISLAFQVIPVLNSSGRLENANDTISLLTSQTISHFDILRLIDLNKKRKELTNEQVNHAEKELQRSRMIEKPILITCDDYHDGVIGLIASRLSEKYKKPSIVVSYNGKGSCRGGPLPDFSIIDLLSDCGEHLKGYGGHKGAAGLSLSLDHFERFSEAVYQKARELKPTPIVIEYEEEIPLSSFPISLHESFSVMEPFGMGNPNPIFYSPQTIFPSVSVFGKNNDHLEFSSLGYKALSFSSGNRFSELGNHTPIDCLYNADLNNSRSFFIKEWHVETKNAVNQIG